jgi:hypothetical protein
MALPAYTLAGLAVKARTAAFECYHLWDETYDGCDWDTLHARSLIAAALLLVGDRSSLPTAVAYDR